MSLADLIAAVFATPNFDHQLKEFEAHANSPARALAWTMRTGKSKAVIDKACHLYVNDRIDGVLIFAPNGVHANWIERELPKHCWPNVETLSLIWRSAQTGTKGIKRVLQSERGTWIAEREAWWAKMDRARKDPRLMFLSVNSESMTRPDVRRAIARFIKHRRIFVVYDESDDFATPGSIRTKMGRALSRRCPYKATLSGTMGGPLQVFSQYELLEKGALGFETFGEFKEHYAITEKAYGHGGRSYPKVIGFKNQEELRERMARFTSVVLRKDVKDMPAIIPTERKIIPTEKQLAIYRELHSSFVVDIANKRVSVGERAPRLAKMQQVFSGFVFDEHKHVKTIPGGNPRLDALSDEIYLSPGKVIVWCQFQPDIDFVKRRLLADGIKIAEYHGRVPDKAKPKALQSFIDDKSVKVLIGHAKSGGRGRDMSAASKIIFYSHTFSWRLRQQALERATKIGGGNIEVMDFIAPGPDAYILETIKNQIDIADAITGIGMKEFLEGLAL